jgi:hypothetical protein
MLTQRSPQSRTVRDLRCLQRGRLGERRGSATIPDEVPIAL